MSEKQPVALVTGGAKRIGQAIVADLAANGFAVAIHCNRSTAEADAAAQAIVKAGGRASVHQADFSDVEAVHGLVPDVAAALGPVQLLVNSASVFEEDHVGALSDEIWDRHFSIHLKAPVFLTEAMAETLPEGDEGMVVNIIDQRVIYPSGPTFFSYTLSKTALWDATRTLAQALAPRLRVNAIAPGPTLKSVRQTDEDFARQVDDLPLKRGPQLTEFGRTIRYLWETKSITGQMIALDGGQHLAWESRGVGSTVE